MKKKIKRATACVCMATVCLPLVSCSISTSENKKVDKEKEQKAFEDFTDELFKEEVQSDSITLNYTVANPENYGVTDFTPTMGKFGVEADKEAIAKAENINKKLDEFEYKELTEDQQLTYDLLRDSYEVKKHLAILREFRLSYQFCYRSIMWRIRMTWMIIWNYSLP